MFSSFCAWLTSLNMMSPVVSRLLQMADFYLFLWLSNIPLSSIPHFLYLLMIKGSLVFPYFGYCEECCYVFERGCSWIPALYPEMELFDYMGNLFLAYTEISIAFSTLTELICISAAVWKCSPFSISSPAPFTHFKNGCFGCYIFLNYWYVLHSNPLLGRWLVNIFSQSLSCLLILLTLLSCRSF